MKYLRPALGVLLGLYVLRNLYYFALTVGDKTGAMPLTGANAGFKPFTDALAWWQIAIWTVLIIAYVIATLRLFRGGKATVPLAVGFVLDAASLIIMRGMATYQQIVPADVQQMDIICVVAVLVGLVVVWWTERSSAPTAAAA